MTNLSQTRDITTPLNFVQTATPQLNPIPGTTLNTAPPNWTLAQGGQAPAATAVQSAFSNIIKTGSAKPVSPAPTTTAPAPAGIATLINPATGARIAAKDSADAQRLFGQGFVLEQTPGVPVSGAKVSNTTTNNTTNVQQTNQQNTSRIPFLRSEIEKLRAEAYSSVLSETPDDLQNLSPQQQRSLRNQKVQGIFKAIGNLGAAIQIAQDQENKAKSQAQQDKENALKSLNTYLKYGVLSKVDPRERQQLASASGLSIPALDAIANQPKETELKTLGADLYQISYGDDGQPVVKLLASGKSSGSGSGSGVKMVNLAGTQYPKEFADWYTTYAQTPGTTLDAESVKLGYDHWLRNIVKDKLYGKKDDPTTSEVKASDTQTAVETAQAYKDQEPGTVFLTIKQGTTLSDAEIINIMNAAGIDITGLK